MFRTACALLLLAPVLAWADDELARFAERSRLVEQKLTGEVNFALSQARVLERTDPARAKAGLDAALEQVRAAGDVLPPEVRTKMTSQLQARLRDVNEAIRVRQLTEAKPGERPRPTERVPDSGPASIAERTIKNNNAQLSALDRTKLERARGFEGAIEGVRDSATPIAGDLEFGKDHARRMEIRKQTVGVAMSPKEATLLKTLASPISVEFNGNQFRQVIEYLSDKTGVPIILDQAALKDAMVEYEDQVTFKAKNLTMRTVLRKILADRGLAYVVREGAVQVTTAARSREMMTTRTYPIDDLVANGFGTAQFGPVFGQIAAQQQAASNAQGIINMIQATIEPAMWGPNGASITYFPPAMALIVRAPAEVHYQLSGSLGGR